MKKIPKSFFFLAGRISLGFAQLIKIRIFTSLLNPEEIGKYYLLMSVISWISLFLIGPISVYISRHIHGWNSAGVALVALKKLLVFLSILTALFALLFFLTKRCSLLNVDIPLTLAVLITPLVIPVRTISLLFPNLCNILGKYRSFIVLSNLTVWGEMATILLFCLAFVPCVETVFTAIVFWGIVMSTTSGYSLYKNIKKHSGMQTPFNGKIYKDVFRFSWPLALGSALFWAQSEGYRFVLTRTTGVGLVGKFVVAYSFGAALMIAIDTLFHQLYTPVFYKEISAETKIGHINAWNKYSKHLVGVCIPVGIYVACAGPFLGYWLLAESYRNMGIYAAIGAFSQLFRILAAASYFGIVAQKNTTSMILPNILGAATALTGTWYLSSSFPIIGTGLSLVFSYILVSILTYICLRARIAVRVPWLDIGKATTYTLPLGLFLLIAFRWGWEATPIKNVIVLLITGSAMVFIQWKLSRDIWFKQKIT